MFESSTLSLQLFHIDFRLLFFSATAAAALTVMFDFFAAVKDGSECEVYSRVGKISPLGHFHLLEATLGDKIE